MRYGNHGLASRQRPLMNAGEWQWPRLLAHSHCDRGSRDEALGNQTMVENLARAGVPVVPLRQEARRVLLLRRVSQRPTAELGLTMWQGDRQ